jgi:hypothetical protein
MARRQKNAKRPTPKTVLRLPDLEQSKNAVLNSLNVRYFNAYELAREGRGVSGYRGGERQRHAADGRVSDAVVRPSRHSICHVRCTPHLTKWYG